MYKVATRFQQRLRASRVLMDTPSGEGKSFSTEVPDSHLCLQSAVSVLIHRGLDGLRKMTDNDIVDLSYDCGLAGLLEGLCNNEMDELIRAKQGDQALGASLRSSLESKLVELIRGDGFRRMLRIWRLAAR